MTFCFGSINHIKVVRFRNSKHTTVGFEIQQLETLLETLVVIPMTFSAPTILSMVGELWQMHFRVLYLMSHIHMYMCRLQSFSLPARTRTALSRTSCGWKGIPMSYSKAMLLYKFIRIAMHIGAQARSPTTLR